MQDEIQRYITFARQFKPRISAESAEFIVDQYKRLRQRDCSSELVLYVYLLKSDVFFLTGMSRSSWRITVRQLESMIRLAEAMSRMHCSDEVQPKHVQEAFRLLNKSIIRVETPEINFEADEPPSVANGDMTNGHIMNGDDATPPPEGTVEKQEKPVTKSVRVTYEQYRKIANLLILHLRQIEETGTEGTERPFTFFTFSKHSPPHSFPIMCYIQVN